MSSHHQHQVPFSVIFIVYFCYSMSICVQKGPLEEHLCLPAERGRTGVKTDE